MKWLQWQKKCISEIEMHTNSKIEISGAFEYDINYNFSMQIFSNSNLLYWPIST